MANTSKTFRLFLSSTFNDMRAERDELQRTVFPRLREYCDKHGFSFQPIDLRWGVSSEAGNDQKTMQICIDEVKRCKGALNPHFAIMLGERYGWIPLPDKVEASEFEKVKTVVLDKFKDNSDVLEFIELWYKKDTNNIPAMYILQPKLTPQHQDWDYWGKVESTLRDAFKSVVEDELSNELTESQKSKYIKSATEQEIVEGLFENRELAKDNIYFYSRNFTNIDSMSEDEFALLEQKDKEYNKTDSTYSITVKHFSDFKNFTENSLDENIRPFHQKLQDKIKYSIPEDNYKEYNLTLDTNLKRTQDSVTSQHLKQFCNDFYNTIFASMEKEIKNFQEQDKQTRELNSQEEFMLEKSNIFVGREDFLNIIDDYIISEESSTPLVLHADSGSGKSALMAKVINNTQKKNIDETTTLIYRFVGTSELSNSPINLLKSLYGELLENEELKTICDEYLSENELQEDTVLSDEKELSKMLANLIENYPEDKKLIFFIDALDQFIIKDKLDWLPRNINTNTKIIISTLPDTYQEIDYLPRLKQKYKDESNYLFLKPFNSDEASSMIDEYLKSFERTLATIQKEKVLAAFVQSGSPLYLKILLEEASQWASYTDIKGDDYIYPKELDALIARLFSRLHTHSHHSLALVNYTFSYIACSKDGLPEPELFDILSQEKNIMDDVSNEFYPRPQRLPTAVWARLYSQMSHYLSIKEVDGMDQISFFHRKFNEGAYKLIGSKEKTHANLADFYTIVYSQDKEKLEKLNIQTTLESALTELPFQLIKSNQETKSLELLTNFEFLMKKFKLNKTAEVLEDYALAKIEQIKSDDKDLNERFYIFDNFLTSNKHILERGTKEWDSSKIFFQLAIEHADNSPLSIDADKYEDNGKVDFDYVRDVNRDEEMYISPLVAILKGHKWGITDIQVLSDKNIISSSQDGSIRIWDKDSYEPIFVKVLDRNGIDGIKLLENGNLLSYSSFSLKIWDDKYNCILEYEKDEERFSGVEILPNQKFILYTKKSIKVLDFDGVSLRILFATVIDGTSISSVTIMDNENIYIRNKNKNDIILNFITFEKKSIDKKFKHRFYKNNNLILPNKNILIKGKDKLKVVDRFLSKTIATIEVGFNRASNATNLKNNFIAYYSESDKLYEIKIFNLNKLKYSNKIIKCNNNNYYQYFVLKNKDIIFTRMEQEGMEYWCAKKKKIVKTLNLNAHDIYELSNNQILIRTIDSLKLYSTEFEYIKSIDTDKIYKNQLKMLNSGNIALIEKKNITIFSKDKFKQLYKFEMKTEDRSNNIVELPENKLLIYSTKPRSDIEIYNNGKFENVICMDNKTIRKVICSQDKIVVVSPNTIYIYDVNGYDKIRELPKISGFIEAVFKNNILFISWRKGYWKFKLIDSDNKIITIDKNNYHNYLDVLKYSSKFVSLNKYLFHNIEEENSISIVSASNKIKYFSNYVPEIIQSIKNEIVILENKKLKRLKLIECDKK